MPTILQALLLVAVGYLLGNFSTGLIVSKLQSGVDIRKYGSGNAGATNMLRIMGRQPALLTFLGDIFKGVLAVGFGCLVSGRYGGLICGTAAIIGHNWPAFFGFRGGKGVATTFAVVVLLFPLQGLLCVIIFFALFFLTRYVSLSSVLSAAFYPILLCSFYWGDWLICGTSFLLFAMQAFRHRTNLRRLLRGEEKRLDLSLFKSKRTDLSKQ